MTRRGFTLAEGLVSLALLGLMAGLLALGVAGAVSFPAQGEARLARVDELVAAQTLLRARIETLSPGRVDSGSRVQADVRGGDSQFEFTAPAPDGEGPRELLRYRLGLARDGTLTLWSVSTLSRDPDPRVPGTEGWQARAVLTGVSRIALDYYGSLDGRARPAWRTAWLGADIPPRLVRLRLSFAAGDRRVWPDLIVEPHAKVPPFCRPDPATGACGTIV